MAMFLSCHQTEAGVGVRAILHTFKAGQTDGSAPEGTPVLDSAGNVYGTTVSGGAKKGMGTVWKLTPGPDGEYTEEILHSFSWPDGANPKAAVVFDSSGNIYGTTAFGILKSPCYDGCGTVFELAASGSGYEWTFLWTFNLTDGGNPIDTLILDGGNLYGTTYGGGTSSYCPGAGGCGVAFELNPSARVTTTVLTSSPNPSTYRRSSDLYGSNHSCATGWRYSDFYGFPEGTGNGINDWRYGDVHDLDVAGGHATYQGDLRR